MAVGCSARPSVLRIAVAAACSGATLPPASWAEPVADNPQPTHNAVSAADNRLGKLLKAGKSNADIIEELFLASLCRTPNDRERSALTARIESAADRRSGLEDLLWGLLNSKEFLLRK